MRRFRFRFDYLNVAPSLVTVAGLLSGVAAGIMWAHMHPVTTGDLPQVATRQPDNAPTHNIYLVRTWTPSHWQR